MSLKTLKSLISGKFLTLAVLGTMCGAAAQAGSVLYWIDDEPATSAIPGAITLAGDTAVAATSDTDFDTQLESGGWSAVIIALQDLSLSDYDANILPDLTSYVTGGGRLIGMDWSSADTGFYSLFDAAQVDSNDTSITNDGNPLFAGITGDIALSNLGSWTIFDQSYSALAGGTGIGPSGGGFGIIEGNGGNSFLDGPLSDSYTTVGQGQQLIANEILGSSSVPEPATFGLLLTGLGGLLFAGRKRSRSR